MSITRNMRPRINQAGSYEVEWRDLDGEWHRTLATLSYDRAVDRFYSTLDEHRGMSVRVNAPGMEDPILSRDC